MCKVCSSSSWHRQFCLMPVHICKLASYAKCCHSRWDPGRHGAAQAHQQCRFAALRNSRLRCRPVWRTAGPGPRLHTDAAADSAQCARHSCSDSCARSGCVLLLSLLLFCFLCLHADKNFPEHARVVHEPDCVRLLCVGLTYGVLSMLDSLEFFQRRKTYLKKYCRAGITEEGFMALYAAMHGT